MSLVLVRDLIETLRLMPQEAVVMVHLRSSRFIGIGAPVAPVHLLASVFEVRCVELVDLGPSVQITGIFYPQDLRA